MKKQIIIGKNSQSNLIEGVNLVADIVKATLGPNGRTVVIKNKNFYPHVTKDGVTVAKHVESNDPAINVGVELMKEVALKTGELAGDGTTTATVLAQAIIKESQKYLSGQKDNEDIDINQFRSGMRAALGIALRTIKGKAQPVKSLKKLQHIAKISSNGDGHISSLVSSLMYKIGVSGQVSIENSKTFETHTTVLPGYQIDRGMVSMDFINNTSKLTSELEKPKIFITDQKLVYFRQINRLVSSIMQTPGTPLFIICEDIEGEALGTLAVNCAKGNLSCCVIKAPQSGNMRALLLEDLAIYTGATLVSDSKGYKVENCDDKFCGNAEKVIVSKDRTQIINGAFKEEILQTRIKEIEAQLADADTAFSKTFSKSRINNLKGTISVIYVGGATDVEIEEKKDRIDDALCAVKASMEEGYVPGMGSIYIEAIKEINETFTNPTSVYFARGVKVIQEALLAPHNQIRENAYCDKILIEEIFNLVEYSFGNAFDLKNSDSATQINLEQNGIIDPAKVSRIALENAFSIADMIISTQGVIVEHD